MPEIQKEIIGRVVILDEDKLMGYELGHVTINENEYPIAKPRKGAHVAGAYIEITFSDLKKIDTYETGAYQRRKVILASGKSSWVYCTP